MMRHAMMFGCLGLLMALAVGCEAVPSADVLDVRVVDQTEQGGRVIMEVDVFNPNDFPLPMPTADYKVTIQDAGSFTFNGVIPLVVMPMQGTQTLQLPAAYSTDVPLAGKSFTARGTIYYDPPGEFRAFLKESGFPLPDVTFSREGTVE